jgi:hypothetical protein
VADERSWACSGRSTRSCTARARTVTRPTSGSCWTRWPRPASRSRPWSRATRADEADEAALGRLAEALPGLPVVAVSVLDDASLETLPLDGLGAHGVDPRPSPQGRRHDPEPLALEPGATVADVADAVHHDLRARSPARVSGDRPRGSTGNASVATTPCWTATWWRSSASRDESAIAVRRASAPPRRAVWAR